MHYKHICERKNEWKCDYKILYNEHGFQEQTKTRLWNRGKDVDRIGVQAQNGMETRFPAPADTGVSHPRRGQSAISALDESPG